MPVMLRHANAWSREELFDLRVYVTETEDLTHFNEDELARARARA